MVVSIDYLHLHALDNQKVAGLDCHWGSSLTGGEHRIRSRLPKIILDDSTVLLLYGIRQQKLVATMVAGMGIKSSSTGSGMLAAM